MSFKKFGKVAWNCGLQDELDVFKLLTKKLAYPYEYINSETKYNETQLPPKEKFYDSLNDEHVADKDYHDAEKI